jgi:glycosyltransferase involved in cell wall biosynthesis
LSEHPGSPPRVSVCIPAFNAAAYLRPALESVLMQDYRDVEIIVVDNHSTDNTVALVEEFIARGDARIRLHRNDSNIGMVGNLNRCMELSRGAYIKFLMADDLLRPGCLSRMASALDAHPAVTLVACGRAIVDENGLPTGTTRAFDADRLLTGAQAIVDCLYGSNFIGEPTAVMFRRKDLDGLGGGFRADLPQLLDMDLWFRLLEKGDLLYLAEPLCAVRRHAAQMTHANIRSGALVQDNVTLYETYAHKPYARAAWRLRMRRRIYMAHRVWVSRHYLAPERRRAVLSRYGSPLAYRLMPAVDLLRRLRAGFKRSHT